MSAARGGRPPATSTASPAAASAGPPASVTAWYPASRARRGPSSPSQASRGPHGAAPSTSSSSASAPRLRARRRRRQRRRPGGVRRPRRRRARRPRHRPDLRRPLRPRLRGDPPRARRRRGAEASPHVAPSAAKTPAERDRRVADLNAARDIHAAFAALKTAAHSACEARQAAASSAIAAWTRPAVMIVLATASHLAALEASGCRRVRARPGGARSRPRDGRAERVGDVVRRRGCGGGVDGVHASRSGRGGSTRREGSARARTRIFGGGASGHVLVSMARRPVRRAGETKPNLRG